MKCLNNLSLCLIIITSLFFLISTQSKSITFSNEDLNITIKDTKQFIITANYKLDSSYNYLYIYPQNPEENLNLNKAIIRIYFRQNRGDNLDSNVNYLNSDYSTIDFNSGLLINRKDLNFPSATIFIISYETINLIIHYRYSNDIVFPSFYQFSNFQFNQFVLSKGEKVSITFKMVHIYNDYLLILSKTSLRNIEIQVTFGQKEANQMLAYLYPNGYSIFLDRSITNDNKIYLTIKNNNIRDEVLLLGYMHHRNDQLFPNPITNGFQIYLEGNKNKLSNLINPGNLKFDQYFTYQTYSKGLEIEFSYPESDYFVNKVIHTISEYNSMFHYKIDFEGFMRFEFIKTPKRNAIYMQYLDFSDNNVAQKSLQPLITGVPKSIIIPSGKSLYHFLPIERDSQNLYYYLRAKTNQPIYISFEKCTSFPENCNFSGKSDYAVEAIQNIGLWNILPTNRSELQLIYVYCEKECAYDILMSYDDDPLFLFPDNDYTKFIGDTGTDMFILPVFEYFDNKTQDLYIDLTIISGEAELTLKNDKNGKTLDCKVTKIGKRQTYSIKFSNTIDYFKKEIYAVVSQNKYYKNTIYNIMYGSGNINTKILKNNIVNMELLTVPEVNKEEDYTKNFTFINKNSKFYVSISTHTCKIIVEYNKIKNNENYYYHQVFDKAGTYSFKIYLIRDDKYCTVGVEEEVILFAFNSDNSNVLLSENTLINSTISSSVSFMHLFKPKNDAGVDNSFNFEIESLNKTSLPFKYELKRVSFNGLYNKKLSDTAGLKIVLKKDKYISNEQIKKICGSLKDYEVCSLTMTLIPDSSLEFSLKLRKNDFYYAKNLTAQTLISSANTKNPQFFYIDINKNYNIRLLINSYGQDLIYKYEVIREKKDDNSILPLSNEDYSNGLNAHQITILKNEFSKCNSFCRIYIGVKPSLESSKREGSTTFLIAYQYYDQGSKFSDINLPLNYFSQYTLGDSEEVNYILNPIEKGIFFFELFVIKQNENDDSEVTAYNSGSSILASSKGKTMKNYDKGIIDVNIKITKGNKVTFKFRVSSIGQQQIIPIISSFGEKCLSETCSYLFDDLSSEKLFNNDDDHKKFVYFYIPEKENSAISYKLLKYNDDFKVGTFNNTSNDLMKRKNWLQIPISYNEYSVIIQLENATDLTLCSTNYNKPNSITLNYGETRIFSIQRKTLDNITFYINKEKASQNVNIKLHAIKGNGMFAFNNEIYPLGFENAYKEDISIIIADVNKIKLIATNEINGKADEYDDFVFTIEYRIDISNQFLYEIDYDKINSFKFYQDDKINEITFYLNFSERETSDLNMNIKIYSDETIYNINSYFVDNEFILKKLNDPKHQPNNYNSTEAIKTYIEGGKPKKNDFTFAKLEISSDILKSQSTNKYSFIYITFKLKETNKSKEKFKVKIDLYPYNIDNINSPLARNHLFIQKIPSNAQNYKLNLAKSDIYYNEPVKIDYVFPLQRKYNYFITYTEKGNENPSDNDQGIIINIKEKIFGKDELSINIDSILNKKKLFFNLVPENKNEIKEEFFVFSYKNTKSDEAGVVYISPSNFFEVNGNSKNLNYTLHAPAPLLKGNTILIIKIYKQDDIKDFFKNEIDEEDDKDDNIHYYLPLYLLFSDIKPMYTKYEALDIVPYGYTLKTTINDIKHGGDLYLTAICVIEDNEREIYFAYKGIKKNIKNAGFFQDLFDYIEDHIFASIIIIIVIIMILGMLINICRAERKGGRLSSVKVEIEGKLMEEKGE